MTFDLQGACAGFLYALETGSNYIRSGRYKKVVVVAGDKMTAITDYQDRSTCPLFGDACGAVLLEPTTEEVGVMDTILRTDGVGYSHLIMKSGGSAILLHTIRWIIANISFSRMANMSLSTQFRIWLMLLPRLLNGTG